MSRRPRDYLSAERLARAGAAPRRIGLRIVRYREHLGLTQQQVADRAGYTREYLSMIENGTRPLNRYPVLVDIAAAMDLHVSALLTPTALPDAELRALRQDGSTVLVEAPPTTVLVLNLHEMRAELGRHADGHRWVTLDDGVLRIELRDGPDGATKAHRNPVVDLYRALSLFLRGDGPVDTPL